VARVAQQRELVTMTVALVTGAAQRLALSDLPLFALP